MENYKARKNTNSINNNANTGINNGTNNNANNGIDIGANRGINNNANNGINTGVNRGTNNNTNSGINKSTNKGITAPNRGVKKNANNGINNGASKGINKGTNKGNPNNNSRLNNSPSNSFNSNIKKRFDGANTSKIGTSSSSQGGGFNKAQNIKNGVEGAGDIVKNVKSGSDEPFDEQNVSKVVDGLSETNIPYVSQGAKVVKAADKVTGGKVSRGLSKILNKIFGKHKKLKKIVVYTTVGSFAFILLFVFIVFADENQDNLSITNNSTMTNSSNYVVVSELNARVVRMDINNLTVSNIQDPIYVIEVVDGYDIQTVHTIIKDFVTNNSIEDYFIINSSTSITDDDLRALFDNRMINKANINQDILNSGLVQLIGVGEAASIELSSRIGYLFPNGLPTSSSAMQPYLTTISVPACDINGNIRNISITVHTKLADEVMAIFNEMAQLKFPLSNEVYGFSWRGMASNNKNRSHHSYGVAIDINASSNPAVYWGSSPDPSDPYYINQTIVEIWKKHGFYWGGDWSKNYYDPMHFSYTNH